MTRARRLEETHTYTHSQPLGGTRPNTVWSLSLHLQLKYVGTEFKHVSATPDEEQFEPVRLSLSSFFPISEWPIKCVELVLAAREHGRHPPNSLRRGHQCRKCQQEVIQFQLFHSCGTRVKAFFKSQYLCITSGSNGVKGLTRSDAPAANYHPCGVF